MDQERRHAFGPGDALGVGSLVQQFDKSARILQEPRAQALALQRNKGPRGSFVADGRRVEPRAVAIRGAPQADSELDLAPGGHVHLFGKWTGSGQLDEFATIQIGQEEGHRTTRRTARPVQGVNVA